MRESSEAAVKERHRGNHMKSILSRCCISVAFAVPGTNASLAWAQAAPTALSAQAAPRNGAVPRDTAREQRLLQAVKAPEGFKVTLFAGPPVAMYPTCLTTGADGALFLCVDPNLSLDAVKGRGRIIRLVDANNDGVADRFTTFAELDS